MRLPSLRTLSILSVFTVAACSSGTNSGTPRIDNIPPQQTPGEGATFSFDLAPFVSDPEGQPLSYATISGGGTVNGSVYENVFPTIGLYTVSFSATDGSQTAVGSFVVDVLGANLAVVQQDSAALGVIDSDTDALIGFSQSVHPETFHVGLSRGEVIFSRTVGGNTDLFAFVTADRTPVTIGDSSLQEDYAGVTSTDLVVFSVGDSNGHDLFYWNPVDQQRTTIANDDTIDENNVMIGSTDLIYYEEEDLGVRRVFVYDIDAAQSIAISPLSQSAELVDTVPDGSLIYRRRGQSQEWDLYYWSPTTGELEIGADVASIDLFDKSFAASTSDDRIVFAAGTSIVANVYVWDPATTTSTRLSTATQTVLNTFGEITANDIVVFTAVDVNGGDDLWEYDLNTSTAATIDTTNVAHIVVATAETNGENSVVWTVTNVVDSVYVHNFDDATTYSYTGQDYVFDGVLDGGTMSITQTTGGSQLFTFDPSDGSQVQVVAPGATVPVFAGVGPDLGDLMVEVDAGGQVDLFWWDASATALITIGDAVTDDLFQSLSADHSKIMFGRTILSGSEQDLFTYDIVESTTTQLTTIDSAGLRHDYQTQGVFHAQR